jgi:PKD repeat protein
MKPKLLLFAFGTFLLSNTGLKSQQVQPCNTMDAMEQHFRANPGSRAIFEKSRMELMQQAASAAARPSAAVVYTIPVVFHILHTYGTENISDATCISALDIVNNDFARMAQDTPSIVQPFKSLFIPSDIRFMLAHTDPNGNCTNGIVHHYDTRTTWDQSNFSYYAYTWNPTKYLNIYIVKSICPTLSTCSPTAIIVGYTRLPGPGGLPAGSNGDAIVFRHDFLGSSFPEPRARNLTHEIGHWLGLSHTFGFNNNPGVTCGDDNITDTPPTKGAFSQCPSSLSGNSCASVATTYYGVGQQNTQNIMDYSSCARNFTQGQTNLMRTVVTSTFNNRQNLWQPATLASTGVNNSGNCAPVADFNSVTDSYSICAGGSLQFKDHSYNAVVTTYAWAGDNGVVISNSGSQNPTVTFPNVGATNLTLTVSNSQGSSQKVKTIYVMDATAVNSGAHMESFELGLPAGWDVINPNPGSGQWEPTSSAAYDGGSCFFIDGSQSAGGQIDILQTPVFSAKSNPFAEFEFAVAYAKLTATHKDELKIQASDDCGATWVDLRTLSADSMRNNSGEISTTSFTPTVSEEWRIFTLRGNTQWNGFMNSEHVMLRFTFIEAPAGYGNNIFLDAVRLFGGTGAGINEFTTRYGLSLQPNPTNGQTLVNLTLSDASLVNIQVRDASGRKLTTDENLNLLPGEHAIGILNDSDMPAGIYFVHVSINGMMMMKKLVIQ